VSAIRRLGTAICVTHRPEYVVRMAAGNDRWSDAAARQWALILRDAYVEAIERIDALLDEMDAQE
jgi:hypothetical protein